MTEEKKQLKQQRKLQKKEEKAKRKAALAEAKAKHKKESQGFWAEFKKFISKGNIIDLAVAMVIGTAFNAIVKGVVDFVITPFISYLTGDINLEDKKIYLQHPEEATETTEAIAEISIKYGSLIQATINFLIIAMTVFLLVRTVNKIRKATDEMKEKWHSEEAQRKAEEEEKKKAEEKAKAEAEAAALEAEKAALAERERQFYENVQRQTELLADISAKLDK